MLYSVDRYTDALRFAAARHLTQKVPGSELPYVVHVVTVAAEVIAQLPLLALDDPDLAITCALLHDTLEDTAASLDELRDLFGATVAEGVDALTKRDVPEAMFHSLARIRQQRREIWVVNGQARGPNHRWRMKVHMRDDVKRSLERRHDSWTAHNADLLANMLTQKN